MMTCSVDLNNKDLDISFYVFKPTVFMDSNSFPYSLRILVVYKALYLGAYMEIYVMSCNQIIWYGAWQKRSSDEKDKLTANLQSMLTNNITRMAVLVVEHNFLDAYAGESRDGSLAVKFSTGDIISMNSVVTTTKDLNDLCYAVLAIFRSRFPKTEGITSGLCMKGQCLPRVVCIHVWQSLQFCYSWILSSDHRKWMMPYLERFSTEMKHDIF
ncbi:hypothetical protein GmHk_08G022954 [Glycine max]|nr:hypothetical protein GmHk_08G022954 [Glycine max]